MNINDESNCADIDIDNDRVVEDVSMDMFEHEPDFAPFHHCKTMNINCLEVHCIFNRDGWCYSNGIFVGSEENSAPCNSYTPK